MRHLRRCVFAICVVAASSLIAEAHAPTAQEKLGRGLAAVACGFLEVPGNIVEQTEQRGAIGVPIGLALGLGMFVARELVGLYEVLSSPFPAPAGYRPILEPEYPWDYFN
ncbi:MAG TPA: exosortase system-associated protein, TIGR04073 family [Rhodospirillales bacterium]|nr:exosortase system-associated protein, TIGR04073 family [Rhodospirillales bacterium]